VVQASVTLSAFSERIREVRSGRFALGRRSTEHINLNAPSTTPLSNRIRGLEDYHRTSLGAEVLPSLEVPPYLKDRFRTSPIIVS